MAEGLNKVILIGNLGRDPELRFTKQNTGVLSIRMATTESRFDKTSNQRVEETEWHSVIVWGKRGEALNKILSKGSRIAVEGRNKTRSWEKDGQKHYATEVIALNVILLGGKPGESGGGSNRSYGDDADKSFEEAGGFGSGDTTDDDIPF